MFISFRPFEACQNEAVAHEPTDRSPANKMSMRRVFELM